MSAEANQDWLEVTNWLDVTMVGLEVPGRYVWLRPVEAAVLRRGTDRVRLVTSDLPPPHVELSPEACHRVIQSIVPDEDIVKDVLIFAGGPLALANPIGHQAGGPDGVNPLRSAQAELVNCNPKQVGVREILDVPKGRDKCPDWDFRRTSVEFAHALTWGDQAKSYRFYGPKCNSPNFFEVHPRHATWESITHIWVNEAPPWGPLDLRQQAESLKEAFVNAFDLTLKPDDITSETQFNAILALFIGLLYWQYKDETERYCGFFGAPIVQRNNVWREGQVLDIVSSGIP